MLLDENAARSMAKTAANLSGRRQLLYQSDKGWMFCVDGGLQLLRREYNDKTQYRHVDIVYPEGQEPKEDK